MCTKKAGFCHINLSHFVTILLCFRRSEGLRTGISIHLMFDANAFFLKAFVTDFSPSAQ
jgi:hypothetical protein